MNLEFKSTITIMKNLLKWLIADLSWQKMESVTLKVEQQTFSSLRNKQSWWSYSQNSRRLV